MATIAARLYNNGNLALNASNNVIFDEVTTSNIRLSTTAYYAAEFDEVTKPGVAMRQTSTGKVLVNGILDETSSLS